MRDYISCNIRMNERVRGTPRSPKGDERQIGFWVDEWVWKCKVVLGWINRFGQPDGFFGGAMGVGNKWGFQVHFILKG